MGGDDTEIETAEPGTLTTLHDLYRSAHDHLKTTTEKSMDSDRKELAGKLDDALLRQMFWEDELQFEEGALLRLEANDAVAPSIIRRYLDEILRLLDDVKSILSEQSRWFLFPYALLHLPTLAGSIFPSRACLAAIVALLIVTSNTNHEKEKMTLLYETSARLCDQNVIYEAMAASECHRGCHWEWPESYWYRPTASSAGEENEMLQLRPKIKLQTAPNSGSSGDSESPLGSIQSKTPSEKLKASPTPSWTKAGSMFHSLAAENKSTFWLCSECINPSNTALSPQKCSVCGHTRRGACFP